MFRSLLFVPGNNPSMLQNADVFIADGIIFDLEDSITITEKDNARNLVNNYLETSSVLPKKVILRTNPVDTIWFKKDLELLKSKKIDYLLLPKMDLSTFELSIQLLDRFEESENLDKTKIIALIETAKGVNEVQYFAENKRVFGLLLGAEDLANDLEVERTALGVEILFSRSKVVLSSVANKIIPIDTPYTDISNVNGLIEDCKFARSLGMKAKACIHPNQLESVNHIFSPSNEEITWAQQIVKLSIENDKKGAFQYKGKMIDKPIIDKAKKIIDNAKLYDLI